MELINLKIELYSRLLQIPYEKLTDNEADIMYALSFDEDIQENLNKKKGFNNERI